MLRVCALACLLSVWVGAAFANPMRGAEPVAEIPFRVDYEGWITVTVTVNGKGPYDFIIDTGATTTIAFQNLANQQDFTPANIEPIRILGLTSEQRLPAIAMGELEIGGQKLSDHVSVVLKDWLAPRRTPHGVLGLDFLARYVVYVDVDTQILRLYDPTTQPATATRDWSRDTLRRDDYGQETGALYRIKVDMLKEDIHCILDLGATGTVINYAALRRLLFRNRNSGMNVSFTSGMRLQDIFNDTNRARLVRVQTVQIGRARWRRQIFTVFNALVFDELGVDHIPYCLIGTDLMLEHSFVLDFARERIYISSKVRRGRART